MFLRGSGAPAWAARVHKKRAAVCLSEAGGGAAVAVQQGLCCAALLAPAGAPGTGTWHLSEEQPSVEAAHVVPAQLVGAGISHNCQPWPPPIPSACARKPPPGATLLWGSPRSERLPSCELCLRAAPSRAYLQGGAAQKRWVEPRAGASAAVQVAGDKSVALHRCVGSPRKGDSRAVG